MKTLFKIISLLTPVERQNALLVLLLVVIMAFLETLSVVSVMPFLAVLGNPGLLETNSTLSSLYNYTKSIGGFTRDTFLIFLGVGSFLLILVSSAYRTLTHYIMNRYIEMRRDSIATRLLEVYLRQPYSFFLDRHSAELSKTLLADIDRLIGDVIYPTFNMIAYSLVAITITSLLIWVDLRLALLSLGVIGGLYGLVYGYLKKRLLELGSTMMSATSERFKAASEAFGGIKSIKLLGHEGSYLNRFQVPSREVSIAAASQRTLSQVPKFIIEGFAFGGIILIVLVMMYSSGGLNDNFLGQTLPVIGLYTFSAYRLQPALQNVYQGVTSLRFGQALVENLDITMQSKIRTNKALEAGTLPLRAHKKITIETLSYSYPNTEKPVLFDLNFEIPVGSAVGLIGSTGAGKSTLVDLLLGLLSPTHGRLSVDGVAIENQHVLAWQKSLGYVPQEIYLSDSTIYENIAFGMPKDKIDLEQVHNCAVMAQIHDFIEQDLPLQYETRVGERGVRLSGGQRQRIGIARALYHNPEVLLLDEATSALDTATEESVMNAIEKLANQKTIIIVAHRLSTLKKCNQIIMLEKGQIQSIGTYEQIVSNNGLIKK